MTPCGWCGEPMAHYMTHACKGCTCRYEEVRDPYEPHIPAYLDMEEDPDCPIHNPTEGETDG